MIRGGVLTLIIAIVALFGAGCSGDKDKVEYFSTDQLLLSEGKFYALGESEPYTGTVVDWHDNGQKQYEAQMVDGVAEGKAVEWYENGQKMTEVTLKDGQPVGTLTGWHSNGAKQFEMPLHAGQPHGLLTEYDTGNRRLNTTRYVGGLRKGEATGYNEEGQKTWERNYRDNILEGDFVEYHPNGRRSSRTPYENGKPNGMAEGWFLDGKKSWAAEWNGQQPIGVHQIWHPNGKLQRKQIFNKGVLALYTEWHSNGQKTLEANYRGTALVSQKRWDADGKLLLSEGGAAAPSPNLPPARKPDPPKPNPFSAGRRTPWVSGQINRVYKDKAVDVVQTAFGTPDEKQGDVWVYKNLTIINVATRQRFTAAHFYVSKGKVILVEEK